MELGSQLDQYRLPRGTIVLLANDVATRRPPFRRDNSPYPESGFIQIAAVAEIVTLRRVGDDLVLTETQSEPIVFLPATGRTDTPLWSNRVFEGKALASTLGLDEAPLELSLIGLRIKRFCTEAGCF